MGIVCIMHHDILVLAEQGEKVWAMALVLLCHEAFNLFASSGGRQQGNFDGLYRIG